VVNRDAYACAEIYGNEHSGVISDQAVGEELQGENHVPVVSIWRFWMPWFAGYAGLLFGESCGRP
jgi:hypothetical protein